MVFFCVLFQRFSFLFKYCAAIGQPKNPKMKYIILHSFLMPRYGQTQETVILILFNPGLYISKGTCAITMPTILKKTIRTMHIYSTHILITKGQENHLIKRAMVYILSNFYIASPLERIYYHFLPLK